MKLNKFLLFVCFFSIFYSVLFSQYTGNEKKYVIQKLDVIGSKRYSKESIISYSKIREGMEIILPGQEVREAITKLWKTGLFKEINIYATKIEGDKIWIELQLKELSVISKVEIQGVKKSEKKKIIKDNSLTVNKVYITDNLKVNTKNSIEKDLQEKGFLQANVQISTELDTVQNGEIFKIKVDKGKRVKISKILFTGNKRFSTAKLRRRMKNTKRKIFGRFWKRSKFIHDKYEEDKQNIIGKYREYGYRDAKIVSDTTFFNSQGDLVLQIEVNEGRKYYFGNIEWLGNSEFSTEVLNNILDIEKGDPYDVIGFQKKLRGDQKGRDIHTLYLDRGFLFSSIVPIEKEVVGDSVNVEIQINEDQQARINKVIVRGNESTNDQVIYREIRTRPGDLFSKTNLQRTHREIAQLGYFDAKSIGLDVKPNYQTKTVDIEIDLDEVGFGNIELSGGYGGKRFIGTVGLTITNFSLKKLLDKSAWRPIPRGDGQRLSFRVQASTSYQAYSFSFSEPWLWGVRPNSFSLSLFNTRYKINFRDGKAGTLSILGTTLGLGKRLLWPDDYFLLSQFVTFQRYTLDNYFIRTFRFEKGYSNNINYTLRFGRNSSGPNPIYPTEGNIFNIELKMTPPYSYLGETGYKKAEEEYNKLKKSGASAQKLNDAEKKLNQERFKFLEFYKVKFDAKWYTSLSKNFVLYVGTEIGILGAYNTEKGISPFERFYMGGTALSAGRFDGRELIALRGYEDVSSSGGIKGRDITPADGGVIYNKFLMELRYPITLSQTASIYLLTFIEAGNVFGVLEQFRPFQLKRSAGVGARIFMPQFGTIGIDFGYGFDPAFGTSKPSGWETHFILNQQL